MLSQSELDKTHIAGTNTLNPIYFLNKRVLTRIRIATGSQGIRAGLADLHTLAPVNALSRFLHYP